MRALVLSSLLLMTCFTFTQSAPTQISTVSSSPETVVTTSNVMITSAGVEPIITSTTQLPSTLEKSPIIEMTTQHIVMTTTTATKLLTSNEMMGKLPVTTVKDENLIGITVAPEMQTLNHEMIKNHESTESHGETTTRIVIEPNGNKSININPTTTERADIVTISHPIDKHDVQSTIEMPIKIDGDYVKDDESLDVTKKSKLKEIKKKILKTSDKKQKMKQKFIDMNYSTHSVPTYEADAGEMHDTTTAISTSIKTAPTTIKSTTLTSTTPRMTTTPFSISESTTTAALNVNEMKTSVTADVQNNNNKDNIIVLNSNSSGLIVVDVMENFGKDNATMESFEIKMDLIDDTISTDKDSASGYYKDDIKFDANSNENKANSDKNDEAKVSESEAKFEANSDKHEAFSDKIVNNSDKSHKDEVKSDKVEVNSHEESETDSVKGNLPSNDATPDKKLADSLKVEENTDKNYAITTEKYTSSASTDKDDIFLTTIVDVTSQATVKAPKSTATSNDDIILINENEGDTTNSPPIKWNEMKTNDANSDIKITFDNIDLPHQNVNVTIENGELIIDSIDISVLNRAEEELRKNNKNMTQNEDTKGSYNKTDSLEIVLIEDDSRSSLDEGKMTTMTLKSNDNDGNLSINEKSNLATATTIDNSMNDDEKARTSASDGEEFRATTIHFELPSVNHKKIEMDNGADSSGDDIKIKTTDKDSDTIFYISNTEVKLTESIPTSSTNDNHEKKKYPAIYEEDVIVDVPSGGGHFMKNRTNGMRLMPQIEKYEEDIVLSPITNDFDPKDINYIGEAFLDVEESANGAALSENHHIIPLTSDVVIQPVELKDMPSINVPIIGEPPQIELAEMMFSDDYDSKQGGNFRMEEFSPFLLNNRLVKNELQAAEASHEIIIDGGGGNGTILSNKTHIGSVNTVINGTNMTTIASPFANATAAGALLDGDDAESADSYDIQTLFFACLATLAPLILLVIIALTIWYCWQKYRRHDGGNDMISDKSTDPLAEKNIGGSTDELKSTESAMTLNRGNGNLQASTEMLLANSNGDVTPNNHNNHTDTNGSIIKMTMKNNHLIVETEERNDISRDTRETKMHYSPSEKDGVFIVEAARGADQNGSHKPSPLLQKSNEKAPLEIPEEIKIDTLQSHYTPSSPEEERKQSKPEQVQVHTPPAELKPLNDEINSVNGNTKEQSDPIICNGTKTGLSQSDLSLTSSNSSNQNYTYGDKDSYHFEEKGYRGSSPKRIINVHCHDLKPVIENSPPAPTDDHNNKPIITSAIYKNDSQEDHEPLKSDIHARTIPKDDLDVDKSKAIHNKMNGIISTMKNGLDEIISVTDENCNDTIIPPPSFKNNGDCNGELTMDSLSYLPAPPPEDNEQNASELMSLDSFPPPPPLDNDSAAQS